MDVKRLTFKQQQKTKQVLLFGPSDASKIHSDLGPLALCDEPSHSSPRSVPLAGRSFFSSSVDVGYAREKRSATSVAFLLLLARLYCAPLV